MASPREQGETGRAPDQWVEERVVVPNPQGFHLRPARLVFELAQTFQSELVIRRDDGDVNAKSMVHVMSIAAPQGTRFVIRACGEDAREAAAAVADLFRDGFGEMSPSDEDGSAESE